MFTGPAIFRGADFPGLTEFLEVVFEQDANFPAPRFTWGPGSPVPSAGPSAISHRRSLTGRRFSFARFDRTVTFCLGTVSGPNRLFRCVRLRKPMTGPGDVRAPAGAHQNHQGDAGRARPVPEAGPFSQVVTIQVALFVAALGLLIYVLKAKWWEEPQHIVLALPHPP